LPAASGRQDLLDFGTNGRDANFGEIVVFIPVRFGTYIAPVGVHTPGYRGSESRYPGVKEHFMRRINRYINAVLLAAAIVAPAVVVAEARAQEGGVQVRIYDRDHRDYHNWDDREDRAYRRYLADQHRSYREYHRQHYRTQRHYWNWRHSHPDRD
jgi:hypothetical protein